MSDWERYKPLPRLPCQECATLTRQRDLLLKALAELLDATEASKDDFTDFEYYTIIIACVENAHEAIADCEAELTTTPPPKSP